MKKDNELCSQKNNELIQNYAWNLNKSELKIFEYLCCCVNTEHYNKEKNIIRASIKNMAMELNIHNLADGGIDYKRFADTIKKLRDKSVIVDTETAIKNIAVIGDWEIDKRTKEFICYMTHSFKEFTTVFSQGYTFTELKLINEMMSKYTINLYYLVQSWNGKEHITVDINYLRKKLQVPKSSYDNIGKFKQILDNSVDELNRLIQHYNHIGDEISYEIHKQGKKYSTITIYLHNRVSVNDYIFYDYSKLPIEISFETDEDKEIYIDEWIEHHYGSIDYEKYYTLFTAIPEIVHKYKVDKVDAIFSIVSEYVNIINDRYADIIMKAEMLINRFNNRKWYNNYEKNTEKDAYLHYLKSFECWCEQQKKYKQ